MKQGRTLPDLAAELERQANAKRDFLAPAQTIRLRSYGHTELYLNEPFEVGEIAHGQIAEYAGVPKALYDRLRNAAPDVSFSAGIAQADTTDDADSLVSRADSDLYAAKHRRSTVPRTAHSTRHPN